MRFIPNHFKNMVVSFDTLVEYSKKINLYQQQSGYDLIEHKISDMTVTVGIIKLKSFLQCIA
jgi:hypothetical protein